MGIIVWFGDDDYFPKGNERVEECLQKAKKADLVFSPYVKLWSRLHAVHPRLHREAHAKAKDGFASKFAVRELM